MNAAGWTTVTGSYTVPADGDPATQRIYIGTDALALFINAEAVGTCAGDTDRTRCTTESSDLRRCRIFIDGD